MTRFFIDPKTESNNRDTIINTDNGDDFSIHAQQLFNIIFFFVFIIVEILFSMYLYYTYKNLVMIGLNWCFAAFFIYLMLFHHFSQEIVEYDKFNIIINIMTVVILQQSTRPEIIYFGIMGILLSIICQTINNYRNFNVRYFTFILHTLVFSWSLLLYTSFLVDGYYYKEASDRAERLEKLRLISKYNGLDITDSVELNKKVDKCNKRSFLSTLL